MHYIQVDLQQDTMHEATLENYPEASSGSSSTVVTMFTLTCRSKMSEQTVGTGLYLTMLLRLTGTLPT